MINITELETSDFKTCEGVTILKEKNRIAINFKAYYDNAKARALETGKSYTYPKFVPNNITIDLGKIALESWLSVMTSQATPLLKRFFNAMLQNYATQAECDNAMTKIKQSLYDGCHARLAQGEGSARLSPKDKALNDVTRAMAKQGKVTDKDAIAALREKIKQAYDIGENKPLVSAVNARIEFYSQAPVAIELEGISL